MVQGFTAVYGADGADRFFQSTTGWDTPILNDRAAPIYPRHQQMQPHETELVDAALIALSADVHDLK